MPDKNVGWLVPAAARTKNMDRFEKKLVELYKDGNVYFPNPQFLNGDNSDKNLDKCVQALLTAKNPAFDIFAVAGSTGVEALVKAQGKSKKWIVQVVGGNPASNGSNYVAGYHIDAEGVAIKQVQALNKHHSDIKKLTVLYDPTSHTSQKALDAATTEANGYKIEVKPVQAATPADVKKLLDNNPVVGMFMLCPSGMFYDAGPMQDIISLVEGASVPAIFPEREFKAKHSGYPWWVLGHRIPETYERAASLANDALHGKQPKGDEAQDRDDDT